ncbi:MULTISPECIES: serine hydrolase domain-containing protein [unclassified Bradyrhizobium]|uniref:serine hydrolase domain-containing protein n=1 Tax=unclassified Bradyrhizobium TaxID=2631580 RepID=UPI002FF102CE
MFARRQMIIGAAATVGSAVICPLSAVAFEWRKVPRTETGFAPDIESRLDGLIADRRIWGLHSVVVARRGKLVFERYFDGEDENWGRSIGRVAFGPDTLHDLRSVTKSVLGLLYGVALAAGKVPTLDQPILASFPECADLATDPRHGRMTVAHALTMALGLDWNEDIPYEDPNNSEVLMEASPDRYRYIFSRPFMAEPGTRWNRCPILPGPRCSTRSALDGSNGPKVSTASPRPLRACA